MGAFNKSTFDSSSVEYETPDSLFQNLDDEFHFTCDVASSDLNHKCQRYYTIKQNAFHCVWVGTCWCNPPFGRGVVQWIKRANQAAHFGEATTVMLLPARTNTNWWHDEVMKNEVRFLRGRVKFKGCKHGFPFPLAIVIFRKRRN